MIHNYILGLKIKNVTNKFKYNLLGIHVTKRLWYNVTYQQEIKHEQSEYLISPDKLTKELVPNVFLSAGNQAPM